VQGADVDAERERPWSTRSLPRRAGDFAALVDLLDPGGVPLG